VLTVPNRCRSKRSARCSSGRASHCFRNLGCPEWTARRGSCYDAIATIVLRSKAQQPGRASKSRVSRAFLFSREISRIQSRYVS
jgi:hypothetical protein